ncbi:MAG: hypothetical protein A4S09_06360 [Proteobacteria bacterium SG_bin7]|nr:MAG: hypothetical protein A4S09_06360 [Proteobacteria bacterium SG_bin7]
MVKKIAVLGAILFLLSGCKDENLSQIGGYYQGELVNEVGESQQITTSIPNLEDLSEDQFTKIEITPTLATAIPKVIWLRYQDGSILIRSANTDERVTPLIIKNNCASGNSANISVELCWNASRLSLKFTSKDSMNVLSAIYLSKDDNLLPPLGKQRNASIYTLDELLGRAKFLNYSVSQEAERVYQAKKQVTVAVGNLLPHFNTRDALAYATGGPFGLIETVGDFLPFLFPSNWFKWAEAGHLANAERKSFASLRGNEMNAVENLFYLVQRDQNVFSILETHIEWLKKIHSAIEVKEENAGIAKGSADLFSTVIVELAQDLEQLRFLLTQEFASISHAVALPPITGISGLALVVIPDLALVNPIDPKNIYIEAQAKSYEVAALEYLVKASRNGISERIFGFLDPTSDKNLGFGYPASIQIGKSRVAELQKRKNEIFSLVEKRSVDVASDFNASLRAYNLGSAGLKSSQAYLGRLLRELQSGDEILDRPEFLNLMIETSRKVLRFKSNLVSAQYSFMIAKSKLDRLLLSGYYQNLEAGIPQLKISGKR